MTAPTQPSRARVRALVKLTKLTGLALVLALAAHGAATSPAEAAPPEQSPKQSEQPATPERIESAALQRFLVDVDAWDLEGARARLSQIPAGSERDLAEGMLALYEADYPESESLLAGVVAAGGADPERDPVAGRARYYLEVARGAQLALGDAVTLRSDDGRFEAVFADRRDAILAPYLFEAMAEAYDTLGEDVGVRPDHPIRFEFYDEAGKLALVTPLTLDNIYTTGTVGICKYRRVMMITPRVMLHGYGWLDTAVHEYVHYVLTMRTRNNAPVWMQEGMAKLMETRWRTPEGETPGLSEPVRSLLHDALARDELVTLEQMHPSVAMLPSQELAALAYAEAETMLGLLEEERGPEGMATFMTLVGEGVDAKEALAEAWGADFDDFFARWRTVMTARTAHSRAGSGAGLPSIDFRADDDPGSSGQLQDDPSLRGDVFSHLGGGRGRQLARLGVLLTLRGHLDAAVIEYEKARAADPEVRDDPKLARRLGELYLELERAEEALPLLIRAGEHEPDNANIAAAEAHARRLTGDPEGARAALDRAIRQNPFVPTIHCDLAALAELDGDAEAAEREARLCKD
ncbi:hypothetical protein PPSIR1_12923 [Plesiocystis pacifica SIR-1]|uniref:Peptidase MA-like domain-containing protein n=1 Tax=Plesiocystis pacifica SIR-1 TaxID=391625 RepID=A6G089_9BACT|nr:hypothetical protein [Plesiocystis pacifica]EDM80786.1 hypothetical protein PPSIR1_12923 [Plesiocystis pacifica SIR-1]